MHFELLRRGTQGSSTQGLQLLQATLDALDAHIVVIDLQARIRLTNRAWRRFAQDGQATQEQVGIGADYMAALRNAREAGDADAAVVLERIEDLLAGRRPFAHHEYPCPGPDRERWFVMQATPLRFDEDSTPEGAVIAHSDITDRFRAEQTAGEMARQLRERVKEAECLGGVAMLTHRATSIPDTLTAIAEHLPTGFLHEHACRAAITYRDRRYPPDEPTPEMGARLSAPIHIRGEGVGQITVGYDAQLGLGDDPFLPEEQRLIERSALLLGQYLHREEIRKELEGANRIKTQFLNAVSHDLRTPLNALLGAIDMLSETPLSEEQRAHLSLGARAGEKLEGLIDMLLDLARLQHGRLNLKHEPFDLLDVVRRQVELVESARAKPAVTIEIATEGAEPWLVEGDGERVGQVISNLVDNAVKFTASGNVTVRLARVGEEWIRIRVLDTGPGIGEAERERIFDWFFQGERVTEEHGGIGLGLRICLELLRAMGGSIDVANRRDGPGAQFTLLLPLPASAANLSTPATRSQQGSMAAQQTEKPLNGVRVVVADDEPINARLTQALLEQMGAHVFLVDDGPGALAAWRDRGPDHLLLDVQMPGLEGPEVVRRIRCEEAETGRRRTPITMLTAQDAPPVRTACEQAGADGYLLKPVRAADLRSHVARSDPPGAQGVTPT
ncbi:hybrid sensor histidine kinase/response regulator [Halorhodospira halophila]|uniref:histidine kinase n=1 Tax=Halorhodospira halophila (strain DSM 244 / SL1) TaxID=349124 RepID=A1WWN3_HALHL|nr:ATP-binding protein [Halorhodospira halophila]ABM62095.1 histidine kinase [Halorhodospira halophila SL1]